MSGNFIEQHGGLGVVRVVHHRIRRLRPQHPSVRIALPPGTGAHGARGGRVVVTAMNARGEEKAKVHEKGDPARRTNESRVFVRARRIGSRGNFRQPCKIRKSIWLGRGKRGLITQKNSENGHFSRELETRKTLSSYEKINAVLLFIKQQAIVSLSQVCIHTLYGRSARPFDSHAPHVASRRARRSSKRLNIRVLTVRPSAARPEA